MPDQTDIGIIQILLRDSTRSHDSIADELGLSRSAIHRRVNRLQETGVIEQFMVRVDWQKLGYTLDVFIAIFVNTKDFRSLQAELMALKGEGIVIEECYRVTGKYGFMLRVKTKSLRDLTKLYDEMLKIEGVLETNTMFILDEKQVEIEIPLISEE